MGTKTVANDLDNARVWFDRVRLPKDALLNRFADIRDDEYVQVGDEKMRIEVIGQRLLTGRQAIAEAAVLCGASPARRAAPPSALLPSPQYGASPTRRATLRAATLHAAR
eukprot:1731199-Prymnesium_polylepis.1